MGRGDCPFVAVPVFPSRDFRHGYIFINKRSGIRAPKDLEGRRVGVPFYTQTAAKKTKQQQQLGWSADRLR
jgi:4,5-dihydroxyphthalate decarboxylase